MKRCYHIRHLTTYQYAEPVDLSYNQVRLTPRVHPGQAVASFRLTIEPAPVALRTHVDAFGNEIAYFEVAQMHRRMSILADSVVETDGGLLDRKELGEQSWEAVRDGLRERRGSAEGVFYTLPTAAVPCSEALWRYARPSFAPGRCLREAAQDLMGRICREFEFDATATTVSTPLSEVLEKRRGVCQDFAHLGIGCVRSMGLPARYVSGYIETVPPPGKERLVGVDASHGWFAVLDPEVGWLELDPTNNLVRGERHIVVAYGRDYADTAPVKGLTVGSGSHELSVEVDVIPVPEGAPS